MKINLSPQRRDDTLSMSRAGAVLTINGEAFDFSAMSPGDTLPLGAVKSEWFVGPVENVAGELELTLLLPLPVNFSQEQAFPEPLLNVQDGPVALPQPLPAPDTVQVGGFEA
ncbi:hypothetical protein [Pseudomonas allokribbensis]|uniref:hypothetical protein n=1 Tax=Pseudomonas allokribbensis TaxID=2774460 RepID=UPI001787CDAD|nr:hypothetical protein [Pseudomonas allokribbensis]